MGVNHESSFNSASSVVPEMAAQDSTTPEIQEDISEGCSLSSGALPLRAGGVVHSKFLGQSRSVQAFLIVLACVWLLVMTVQYMLLLFRPSRSLPVMDLTGTVTFSIDINRATWVEWMQLEGIGPSMAHRIVADRTLNGPYESVDQLLRITGFGPLMLDRIRPWLTIRHEQKSARPESEESRSTSHQPQAP